MVAEGWTLQGVLVWLTLIAGIVGLLMNSRKIRRENEADAQAREDRLMIGINKHQDDVEKRLVAAEASIKSFWSRSEIEGKFEHEKNNRQVAEGVLQRQVERVIDDVSANKIELARVGQRQDGFASDMAEIKLLLKDQTREISNKIEKLQDSLRSKPEGARA